MKAWYNAQSWHTFFQINNTTLLRMYLRDGVAIDEETKNELDATIAEYCRNEAYLLFYSPEML